MQRWWKYCLTYCMCIFVLHVNYGCLQPDQIVGTVSDLSSNANDNTAKDSVDSSHDDVWNENVQSSAIQDVDSADAVVVSKRSSVEFHEDLLCITPYVKHLYINNMHCSYLCIEF